jgi:hypothetical protein
VHTLGASGQWPAEKALLDEPDVVANLFLTVVAIIRDLACVISILQQIYTAVILLK